jgi:ATP-dependent protease ClpP protease subunit
MPAPNYVAPLRLRPEAHLRNWTKNAERGFRATMLSGEARLQAGGADVEFAIMDVIGLPWREGSITAVMVERELKKFPGAKKIKVLLNSPGGIASEGVAIFNLFKRHPAFVEVEILGEAASAASVVAMAGDRVIMRTGTWLMIHAGLSCACGHAADLRNAADMLDTITAAAVDIYVERTGLEPSEVAALVEATTWLGAGKALELGFADELGDGEAAPTPSADLEEGDEEDINVRIHVAVNEAPHRGLLAKTTGPGRVTPGAREEQSMADNNQDKALLQLLGVGTAAEAVARQGMLGRIETITGKSGEEAIGVLMAWKGSHDQVATLQAKVAELTKATEAAELDKEIADAKAANKLTPAMEATLRSNVATGELTLKGAKAQLATMATNVAMANGSDGKPPAPSGGAGELKHNGKTYAELKPQQRADLKKANPELYEAMKKDHEAKGR